MLKNILIIGSNPYGNSGIANYTRGLANSLSDLGYNVEVITTIMGNLDRNKKLKFKLYEYPKYMLEKKIVGITNILKFSNFILNILKQKNFELIHVHDNIIRTLSTLIALKDSKINFPRIFTYCGGQIYESSSRVRPFRSIITPIYFSVYSKFDMHYSTNIQGRDFLRSNIKNNNQSIKFISGGIETQMFKPLNKIKCRKKLGFDLNKRIILTVGGTYVKGTDFLIESFKYINKKEKSTLFVIVGPKTSFYEKLVKLSKILELDNKVIFVGPKTHDTMVDWYNIADLYVMGSREEYFNAPEVEAMACGVPVVACIDYPKKDILDNEDVRLTSRNRDPKEFANFIFDGLNKDWDTKKLIRFSNQFSWKNITNQVIEIYNKTIDIRK